MGAAIQVVEQGGYRCPYLGENLCSSGSGGPSVQVGDVGDNTAYWDGFGLITPQGGSQTDGTTTLERVGRWMGVSLDGGTDGGTDGAGRITGGGDLRLLPLEHSCTVY